MAIDKNGVFGIVKVSRYTVFLAIFSMIKGGLRNRGGFHEKHNK